MRLFSLFCFLCCRCLRCRCHCCLCCRCLRCCYFLGPKYQKQGWKFCFFGSELKITVFFWLPKRVNRDISCIATKVRKLQIYPFSFQHTRLEYRPPLASKIQMEIHDTHIYVEHIYIYAYCTSPGPI